MLTAGVFSTLALSAYAGSGPMANPATGPQTPVSPDVGVGQPAKPAPGTPDVATGASGIESGTPAPTPAPPGTDTSTAAPGGQAESTKNGALGTTTGDNVAHRHHGPKRPTVMHDRSDASGPPADSTSK